MRINEIKNITFWWFKLLTQQDVKTEDLVLLEKFFGPFEEGVSRENWIEVQKSIRTIWKYKCVNYQYAIGKKIFAHAQNFCEEERCPVKTRVSTINPSESPTWNLIVGPKGHLSEGDPIDFIEKIKNLLSPNGSITKAYYHDPYAIKSINQNGEFIKKLHIELPELVIVSGENEAIKNQSITVPVKKISSDQIHDRFIIIFDSDKKWKGVLIGNSINAFPLKSLDKKPRKHFIITKLEDDDAEKLAEIIDHQSI